MSQSQKVRGVATSVEKRDGWMVVRYHSTDVVRFNSQSIILDSGGWSTFTTKARMNQASNEFDLGYQVWQKDFVWFVSWKGEELEFEDGMELVR